MAELTYDPTPADQPEFNEAEQEALAIGEAADLTESEVNVIKNYAGGEEGYTNLMQWAAGNLDQADVDAFDSIVDKGDARAIRLAVAGLKAQYEAMNGFEGEMVSGKAPRQVNDVFRSQAEVVAAMQDPRYDKDPAYRNDVFQKLERSNIQY